MEKKCRVAVDFNHYNHMFFLTFLMIGYFWDIVGHSGIFLPHHTSQVLYPNLLFYPIGVEYSGLLLLLYHPSDNPMPIPKDDDPAVVICIILWYFLAFCLYPYQIGNFSISHVNIYDAISETHLTYLLPVSLLSSLHFFSTLLDHFLVSLY